MKKLIITCSLIACASVVSFAQIAKSDAKAAQPMARTARVAPSPEAAAERRAKAYQQKLGLNATQYKGVYEAELSFVKQQQELRANGATIGEGQAMQMEMTKDQAIKNVITADQYTKYASMKAKPVSKTK